MFFKVVSPYPVSYTHLNSSKEPEITEVIIPSYHRKKSVGKRDADLSGLPARIIEHTPVSYTHLHPLVRAYHL